MANTLGGKWKVKQDIRSGGQGKVVKVEGPDGQIYAAKIVKVRGFDKHKLDRIQQEVKIIRQLKDASNVVKIYDDNIDQLQEGITQDVWYVMGYAKHGSLADNDYYIQDVEAVLLLFRQVLMGIKAAHDAGAIHRDLKPENILLFPDQKSIMVADFGVGLLTEDVERPVITEEDEVVGPAHFIAPEQYQNSSAADRRSDIYSLGKVLFFMITGKGKVFRESLGDLKQYFSGSNPYLPLIQEKLLEKMVVADPKSRYDSVDEVLEEVDGILRIISGNSHRMLKKSGKKFSVYELIARERLDEFVSRFSKDTALNMRLLEWAVSDLLQDGKMTLIENLKSKLFEKYPKGKTRAAIDASIAFAENPDVLSDLSKGNRYSFAAYYLAKYFEEADSHHLAHNHIAAALDKENDESLKLHYLLLLADICKHCRCSQPHDVENRIVALLRSTSDEEKRLEIFRMLGNHYLEREQKLLGLRYLEAYLVLRPYDMDIRFKCAFEYSEINQQSLALYHYLLHKRTAKAADQTVNNNLGVLYANNGMPMKAMTSYKDASKHDHTLASSNVASQYLSIGLVDEARKLLRSVIVEHPGGDYDERVDSVLGSISRDSAKEDEAETKLQGEGSVLSLHHNNSVNAQTLEQFEWAGYWEMKDNTLLAIKRLKSTYEVNDHDNKEKKIVIIFEGNSATVSRFENRTTDFGYGVIYFKDKDTLSGYLLDGDKISEITATRVVDLEAFLKKREEAGKNLLAALQGRLPGHKN